MHPFEFDKLKKIRKKQLFERNKQAIIEKLLNRRKKQAESLKKNQIEQNNANEIKFKKYLIINNISFIWQKPFYDIDRYVCVDFFLTDYNIVIEIDGLVHKKMEKYDYERSKYLKNIHNISDIVRFKNKDIALYPDKINNFLSNLKHQTSF
jgi:very-short-patch-repair endonuclease